MAGLGSEFIKALNRPHGPVKALMWFTIAFGGSYVYLEHIKPAQDRAAWEQMKKDITASVSACGCCTDVAVLEPFLPGAGRRLAAQLQAMGHRQAGS